MHFGAEDSDFTDGVGFIINSDESEKRSWRHVNSWLGAQQLKKNILLGTVKKGIENKTASIVMPLL